MKTVGASVVFLLAVAVLTWLSVSHVLGRLPGDLVIDKGGVVVYLPITTAIVVSVLLSLVLWFFRR